MQLPKALDFLVPHLRSTNIKFTKAPWLLSEFEEPVWVYNFNFKNNMTLSWGVELHDGSSLLESKNRPLLTIFKHWLIVATQNKGRSNVHTTALRSQCARFNSTLHNIDYMLLNSKSLELADCGVAGLSENDLMTMINTISSSNKIAEGVYGWADRLSEFCIEILKLTPAEAINEILMSMPALSVITDEQREDNSLSLPLEMVPSIRACLFLNDYYSFNSKKGYNVNSKKINQSIYKNTIAGVGSQKPSHLILSYSLNDEVYVREFPGVPVKTAQHVRMSKKMLRDYQLSIISLKRLAGLGLQLPPFNVLDSALQSTGDGGEQGRFRSVPADVIFSSFRHAIEFHKKFGRELISSYCRMASYCVRENKKFHNLSEDEFLNCMDALLIQAGVRKLGLSCRRGEFPEWIKEQGNDKSRYFTLLRSNTGFLEMLAIYYGAVEVVVGLLMARRCSELRDLDVDTCLDDTKSWLFILNRKSAKSVGATKQLIARPIDPVAADMIFQLITLHKELRKIGFLDDGNPLFSVPALKGTTSFILPDVEIYYRNIDLFQDYIQSNLDSNGRRYYLRQHQMRRFFALLFFNCSNFGGIETLRWMLGHSDIEHLYNYITETVPGAELRGSKADFMFDNLEKYAELSGLLEKRYGTSTFNVSESERVTRYLEELLDSGDVEMEPDFIEDENGKHMRVVVVVRSIDK